MTLISFPCRHHVVKGATGYLEEGRVTPGLRASPDRHRNGLPFSSPSGILGCERGKRILARWGESHPQADESCEDCGFREGPRKT